MLTYGISHAGPITGKVTPRPRQAEDLGEDKLYVNLHTTASPDGEARAEPVEK